MRQCNYLVKDGNKLTHSMRQRKKEHAAVMMQIAQVKTPRGDHETPLRGTRQRRAAWATI